MMKTLAILIFISTIFQFEVSCMESSSILKLKNSSLIELDTSSNVIQPGVNICTKSRLSPPLKKNTIYIGVIGTYNDPVFANYNFNATGCSTNETNCLIPEYIISLVDIIDSLNNKEDILPYHRICLRSAIANPVPNLSTITSTVFEQCIEQDDLSVVINTLWGGTASFIHAILLPYTIPVMSFSIPGNYHRITVDTVIDVLTENSLSQNVIEQNYLFTMAPDGNKILKILNGIAKFYGWTKIGLIFEDHNLVGSNLTAKFIDNVNNISYTAVQYMQGMLLMRFQPFIEKEIQVFIFHGGARVYLRLLYEAARHDFVNTRTTWIYSYHDVIFPENYPDIWCGFTKEEALVIKNALKGSIVVGLNRGIGEIYEEFKEHYGFTAEEVAGSSDERCNSPRFTHTAYVHDSVYVVAKALHSLVENKTLRMSNVSQRDVQIGRNDHSLLTQLLIRSEVDAATGTFSFRDTRKRKTSLFIIRNFIPRKDNIKEVALDPWILKTKAVIESDGAQLKFTFYGKNGEESNVSTIIFADGTTNIPLDHPPRIYIREPSIGILAITIFNLAFVVTVISHLVYIYYEDVRAIQLVNISIYGENDLRSGKNVFHKKIPKNSSGSKQESVAQLKKRTGKLVQLTYGKFTRSLFTKTVYLEINKLRTMSHPNVALLYGCLLSESRAAFLHEYCSRGTLQDVLNNSDLELDWVFKLSFALDAAEGMAYLHSRRVVHGRLSTSTCSINEQWTLKIKDYGLKQLHKPMDYIAVAIDSPFTAKKNIKRDRTIPPEVRLFGESLNYDTDIYSYGIVLEELTKRTWNTLEGVFGKSLLGKSKKKSGEEEEEEEDGVHRNSLKNDYYEEVITPKVKKVIRCCLDSVPQARPGFDWIANKLRQTSYFFEKEGQANLSMLQIYSRRLEERLEDMGDLMVAERDHSNDVIRSFIPESMIVSEEKGQLMSLKQYNKAVLSIEITNAEYLMSKVDIADFNRIIVLLQKTVEGVISNFDMNRIQTRGTTWIIVSVDEASAHTIHAAICAAQSVFDNLKDIPVPGHPDIHPIARAGLHAGDIACGVVEQPIPKVVCFGTTIAIAIQLMLCSKDGRTLASTQLTEQLSQEDQHLQMKSHIAMEIDSKLITTMWVQMPMYCPRKPTKQTAGLVKLPTSYDFIRRRDTDRIKISRPFSAASHRLSASAISPGHYRAATLSKGALFSDHYGTQYSETEFSPILPRKY